MNNLARNNETVPEWHKSSYSNAGANCVEVATNLGATVPVRDSKLTNGPVLTIGAGPWSAFLGGLDAV
ncbi:DUF397 domain-containing protein [Streptomyces albidoflavus]